MINVAIMGHGVVGSGVAEILIDHADRIEKAVREKVNVKYILDLRDFEGLSYSDKFIKDFEVILNDDDIKVVAEVMGGINPAYDFVKRCLLRGKSVATSNKELVAAKGAELIKIAQENNVNFLFEASVGGGIPILRPMAQCLCANEITQISGILNGTTNYILNKMIVDNMDFSTALSLAQQKGYAEKDPTAAIEGHDACRKICILAAMAFGKHVYPEWVYTEGITDITLDDAEYADNFGYVIKLIGHTEKLENGKITASVRPTLVGRNCLLSGVDGVFNAVMVTGDQTGDVIFYGKGAGKKATASAVAADMVDCIKHLNSRKYLFWEDGDELFIEKNYDKSGRFYVCIKSDDYDSLLEQYKSVFSSQKTDCIKNEYRREIAFITDCDRESSIRKKLSGLRNCEYKLLHTML